MNTSKIQGYISISILIIALFVSGIIFFNPFSFDGASVSLTETSAHSDSTSDGSAANVTVFVPTITGGDDVSVSGDVHSGLISCGSGGGGQIDVCFCCEPNTPSSGEHQSCLLGDRNASLAGRQASYQIKNSSGSVVETGYTTLSITSTGSISSCTTSVDRMQQDATYSFSESNLSAGTYTVEVLVDDCNGTSIDTNTFTIEQQTATLSVTKAGTGSGTVTSSPSGINCGSDCNQAYNVGTTVNLTATSASGSTFDGWQGGADCSDGTVTMDFSKTCEAVFNVLSSSAEITLEVDADGPSPTYGPYVEGTVTVPYNQDIVLRWRSKNDSVDPRTCSPSSGNWSSSCASYFGDACHQNLLDRTTSQTYSISCPNPQLGESPVTDFVTVNVEDPDGEPPIGSDVPGTIYVNSNLSTTWTLSGPEPRTQSTNTTSQTYTSMDTGTYSISPASQSGYTVSVSPSSSQTLNGGSSITFDITYSPTSSITGVCAPTSQTVEVGATASFYTMPSGASSGSWYAAEGDPSFKGCCSNSFQTTFSTTGTKSVSFSRFGQETSYCTVNVVDSATLQVRSSLDSLNNSGVVITEQQGPGDIDLGGTTGYNETYPAPLNSVVLRAPHVDSSGNTFSRNDGIGWANCDSVSGRDCTVSVAEGAIRAVRAHYTSSTNNASCVGITAPSTVTPGQVFSATITMQNTGTKPWTNVATTPHRLGSQPAGDNTWGATRVNLPTSPINPGSNVSFTRNFTAPGTPATYNFDWRMLEESVQWFGASCTKQIQVAQAPGTITVNSNIATTWNGTGPKDFSNTSPVKTRTYTDMDGGTYTIVPASIPGWTYTIAPCGSSSSCPQYLSAGSGITFTITYTDGGSLACEPYHQSINTGGTASFTASGGSGSFSWSAPGGSPSSGGDVPTFASSYSTNGLKIATVTRGGANDQCFVSVSPSGNQLPVGTHDTADSNTCTVDGWSTDPDDRSVDLTVRIYGTNTTTGGSESLLTTVVADDYRSDLTGVCPEGTCSFTMNLSGLVTPGNNYSIRIAGVDAQTGTENNLNLTPRTINCPETPDFFLSSSNDIKIDTLSGTGTSNSSTITVNPLNGFTSSVALSASSALDGSATYIFGDPTLSSAKYETGSTFRVQLNSPVSNGIYPITVTGEGGGLERTVIVNLLINSKSPQFEEF